MRLRLGGILRRAELDPGELPPRFKLRIAERFIAPANLASLHLPPDALARPPGRLALCILEAEGTTFRTGFVAAGEADEGDRAVVFAPFDNTDGACFLLYIAEAPDLAEPALLERLRSFGDTLKARPPIVIDCNRPTSAQLPAASWDGLCTVDARSEPFRIAYDLDQGWCWCDAHGIYLSGWLHCYDQPLTRLEVQVGSDRVRVENFHERPDLLDGFPTVPNVVGAGFKVYVPCRPGVPVEFHVETPAGRRTISVELPRSELPPVPSGTDADAKEPFLEFCDAVNYGRLTVLHIGSRVDGATSIDYRDAFKGAARYIGMDVHPSPTVDVVGDAHELSKLFGQRSLDAVFSISVLEHLAMPWIVAAEINRALKIGGLVFHSTPQSWPIHAAPNDFWRFSDEGLKMLFGPAFGFEVLQATMRNPMRLYPEYRVGVFLETPLCQGYGEAIVLARKVAELPRDLDRLRLHEQGRLYPARESDSQS